MRTLALAAYFASMITAATPLQRDHPIAADLAGDERQSYSVVLGAGDFIRVVAEQNGIDVVVTAYDSSERKLAEVDSPNGENGPEPLAIVAPVAGTYRFEVSSLDKNAKPGKVEVRIDQWLTAAQIEAIVAEIRDRAKSLVTVDPGHGFDDLTPLADIVGEARVVALGEATHGTHEFFRMKHRILEFLVARKGFNVFAIEATMPEAFDVNEYVLTGKGDPRKALTALYFWTWNTEEILDLIEWMRRYNADAAHTRKVKFYGIDMQFATRAAKVTRAYLELLQVRSRELATLSNPVTEASYDLLPEHDRAAARIALQNIIRDLDEHKAEYEKKTSAAAFAIARQNAEVLRENLESRQPNTDWRLRDASMAANLRWVLQREGPAAKVMVWAHNLHVGASPGSFGAELRRAYGGDVALIGFAFNEGSFQAHDVPGPASQGVQVFTAPAAPAASFEWMATATHIPIFVLDLRKTRTADALSNWLAAPVPMRNVGSIYSAAFPNAFFAPHNLRDEFDAFLFVATTTAAKPNPGAPLHALANLTIAAPANLDFEVATPAGAPAGWIVPETAVAFDYAIRSAEHGAHDGTRAAVIRRDAGKHYGETAGTLAQRIDATPYRGKRIRVSAYGRRKDEAQPAYIYVSVTAGNPSRPSAVFRGQQPVTSARWQQYSVDAEIAKDAVDIEYGLALAGDGEAWIDTVAVTTLADSPP